VERSVMGSRQASRAACECARGLTAKRTPSGGYADSPLNARAGRCFCFLVQAFRQAYKNPDSTKPMGASRRAQTQAVGELIWRLIGTKCNEAARQGTKTAMRRTERAATKMTSPKPCKGFVAYFLTPACRQAGYPNFRFLKMCCKSLAVLLPRRFDEYRFSKCPSIPVIIIVKGVICRLQLLILLILFACILLWLLLFYGLQRLERFSSHSLI
jgi:hypothetical protein